jgi:hypothetical protein
MVQEYRCANLLTLGLGRRSWPSWAYKVNHAGDSQVYPMLGESLDQLRPLPEQRISEHGVQCLSACATRSV